MYVIAIKNRQNEFAAMKILQEKSLLRDDMIPLVEVIQEKFTYDDKIDPFTGEIVREGKICKGGKIIHRAVRDMSSPHDVTLDKVAQLFPDRPVMVDYFRCDLNRYRYKPDKIPLVIQLNRDLGLYKTKVLGIAAYPNLIPIITVKRGIDALKPDEVVALAGQLRADNPAQRIAIRIDDLEGYESAVKQVLRADDFLLYDFNEQPIRSKPIECMQLRRLNLPAHLIALCSPRARNSTGKDFPNGGYANIINNTHLDTFANYGFQGVGDYGGLRDNLPYGGTNKGRALAVLYDGSRNEFKTFVNDDYNRGPNGYQDIIPAILADATLNPKGNCVALGIVAEKYAQGMQSTFAEWIKYTLIRYIQQLSESSRVFQ